MKTLASWIKKWKTWTLPTRIALVFTFMGTLIGILAWQFPKTLPAPEPHAQLTDSLSLDGAVDTLGFQKSFAGNRKNIKPYSAYLKDSLDKYKKISMPGLRFGKTGFMGSAAPKYASTNDADIQLGGFLPNGVLRADACARLSLVTSGNMHLSVDSFYIRLHAFSPCSRRDEGVAMGDYGSNQLYEYHISENYTRYDIIPLEKLGSLGKWELKGNDYEEFGIDFFFEPYTLYIISFELRAKQLPSGQAFRKSSAYYPLIRVENGNVGGCLSLGTWFDSNKLYAPDARVYSEKLSTKAYQVLVADNENEESIYLEASTSTLKEICSELEQRPDFKTNPLLERKYNTLKRRAGY